MNSIHESQRYVIQQALHGYSDGHRLLASSCKLPRDAESLMLILSDLSGPGGGDQFDPYLTGYPLESAGRYALACTWPAPEMKRPGCVWTHTLLLGEEMLAETNNPEEFAKLFRRPTTPTGFGEYLGGMRVPELFGARSERTRPLDDWTAWLGPRLLQALYGSSAPFTALAVPRYAAAEMPLLSIWRLQWPKLRRQFTFCGGSRAVRTVDGRPMDLQAAVERDIRRIDRGAEPPAVVPGDPTLEPPASEWLDTAAAAYLSPDAHNLIGFFNRIGDALPADPALFRPAVMAYSILGRSPTPDAVAHELVNYMATEYPDAAAGSEIKCAFLGAGSVTGLTDLAVLHALADTEFHLAFEACALHVRPRSAALWASSPEAWGLMSRLLSTPGTPLSEVVLGGLIDAMPTEALLSALDAGGGVLEGFVRRRPQIAATPQYWTPPADRQSRAARVLPTGLGVRELMGEIIRVALEIGADPTAPDLVEVFGDESVPLILDWLGGSPERTSRLPWGWANALRRKPINMLAWLCGKEVAGEETARFILSGINIAELFPNHYLITALTSYLPIIEAAGMERGATIACAAFKVALNADSREGAELAVTCLDVVYRATMNSRLPDESWWNIANDLPQSYWWQDWDRCERLRNAVVERFRSGRWPASLLVEVTKDDVLFGTLVDELRDSKSGRRILREAIDNGVSGRKREILLLLRR